MATVVQRQTYSIPSHKNTLPITMPQKSSHNYYSGRVAMSPAEVSDYSSSRSGPSYSARSSTYAGSSSGDYDGQYSSVDAIDSLSERMNRAFDPITMDRGLARQAQASGNLNAKQRELAELRQMAAARSQRSKVKFEEGMKAARETQRDLDYIQSSVSSMRSRASRDYPDAYARASQKYSSRDYY